MLFVGAGTISGSLVGFVAALPLLAIGGLSDLGLAIVAAVGLALDALRLAVGAPRPPTYGRQVPQEWGRLFRADVVAVLYGARLGVGPLTILSTWTWWSITVAAAVLGPTTGAVVGATFGLVRTAVTVVASSLAARPGRATGDGGEHHHVAWFQRLRNWRRPNWLALNGAGLLLVAAWALSACSGGDGDSLAPQPFTELGSETAAAIPTSAASTTSTTAGRSISTESATVAPPQTTPDQPIVTVHLEDIVRTAPSDAETSALTGRAPSSRPVALAEALVGAIDGFEPIDDPAADRYLDLAAAADIQPDPTEEVALLETRGFQGGWTRAFRNEANDVAVMSVYQFEDAAEAEFYLEDGLITIGGYGGRFFDIEGLAGVRGFVQHFSETDTDGDEDLVSLGAAFQVGPRWYLVYFVGSTETVTPDVLIPAVTSQRAAADLVS